MTTTYRAVLGLVLGALLLGSAPARADLQDDIDQAVSILERMPPKAIPESAVGNAHGIAIFNAVKLAVGIGIGGGTGVVVARTDSGWSAPAGIGGGGGGFGLQIGVKVDELILTLNTPRALDAFSRGNFALGADAGVAFFPWGRIATVGVTPQAAVTAWGNSQGLFAGLSLEGSMIAVRDAENARFYGKPLTAKEILSGSVPVPESARKLMELLDTKL